MNKEKNKAKKQYNIEKTNNSLIDFQIEEVTRNLSDYEQLINFTQRIREYKEKIYELKMKLSSDIDKTYEIKNSKILEALQEKKEWLEGIDTTASIMSIIEKDEDEYVDYICKNAQMENEYPMSFLLMMLNKHKEKKIIPTNSELEEGTIYLNLGERKYGSRELQENTIEIFISNCYNPSRKAIPINKNLHSAIKYEKINRNLLKKITTIDFYKKLTNKEKRAIQRANIQKSAEIFRYYEQEIEFWQEMNLKRAMENDEGEHYLE